VAPRGGSHRQSLISHYCFFSLEPASTVFFFFFVPKNHSNSLYGVEKRWWESRSTPTLTLITKLLLEPLEHNVLVAKNVISNFCRFLEHFWVPKGVSKKQIQGHKIRIVVTTVKTTIAVQSSFEWGWKIIADFYHTKPQNQLKVWPTINSPLIGIEKKLAEPHHAEGHVNPKVRALKKGYWFRIPQSKVSI
jgi:hypothetical protein